MLIRCRALVLSLACLGFVAAARGAEKADLSVLTAEKDGSSQMLLKQYQMDQLRPFFQARLKTVADITTPEKFAERQAWLRATLHEINGEFPEKTPLNSVVTKRIERDDYTIENVIFESRPRHYVTGNLYVPRGLKGKTAGVIVPCGHSANGKAIEAYQSMGISLARNGMVSLVYDPVGQGERHQLLDPTGKPQVAGTTEHSLIAVGGWLVGRGTAHYRIWDGIRAIDYLCSRPEVDPEKIGCSGNSGGGTLTSYLMAFDDRIQAAAPSCYITTIERLFDTLGPQDGEQHLPGQVALGIDHADYIVARAPKPTIILCATQDFFDIDGTWTTFRETKRLYDMLGVGERMDLFENNAKHNYSLAQRTAGMRFMRRWLLGKDDNPNELPPQLSTEAELRCTRTGEVMSDFPDGVGCFDLNRIRAAELLKERESRKVAENVPQLTADIRRLTGVREQPPSRQAEVRGTIKADRATFGFDGEITKLALTAAGEVPIAALLYKANGVSSNGAILHVSGAGKSALAEQPERLGAWIAEGKLVLSVDLRGFGETSAGRDGKGYFGTDFQTALLAMHLKRPLLGQRTEDLLSAIRQLVEKQQIAAEKIEIVSEGAAVPIALHAAALEPGIRSITLVGGIESWTDVAGDPLAQNQLTNVVPFVLEAYDLPELETALKNRKATVTRKAE